jgi:hypothetical protein
MKRTLFLALFLLAACRDDRPPAPTAEESDQLNDAENMLNAEANAQPARNQKGPEDRSPGPSQ